MVKVEDVMQPVLCVPQDATLKELYEFLTGNAISGAPVVDSRDYLVGVVSLTDIIGHITGHRSGRGFQSGVMPAHKPGSQKLSFKKHEKTRVREVMSDRAYSVGQQDDILEVIELMLSEDIHRVIVTHRDHVVGIVTTTDVLKVYRDELLEQ